MADRYDEWEKSIGIPLGEFERTVSAVIEEARAQTRGLVELPPGEEVVVEFVHDKPWRGFNHYVGDVRATYVAGRPERFCTLLTEQVRVRDLLEAVSGPPASRTAQTASVRAQSRRGLTPP